VSPRVKHSVMSMIRPMMPLTMTPYRMALGSVREASLISSAVTRCQQPTFPPCTEFG
jgi:hypothetical protein